SAQIREILINESAWEEMTCLFALSLSQTTDTFAAFHASSVCKFTQILQLPQNTKGGIARC
ncbi:hypothetical protein ELE33_21320, partial [Klebsiella pneumoniae]|nr:hypothetical protein [Klebsiella pneumoniae]